MKERKQYSVGIYCRLSKDDIGSGDSSSILSQKAMLEEYVHSNGWTVFDFYVDDGYSGTNFNRPDFQRMIDDIDSGNVNMVVVKDLSRLGRNYLMTGQYTEVYFPDREVRFVALNDGIDTENSDNDIAPFKNILNEMYSKDISKKVRSAVKTKKQRGEYLSNYAPYGYMKDPDNKNHLVIEESGAEIVRRMFEMGKSGMGSKMIANTLTREGILSPINHRAKLSKAAVGQEPNRWNAETVNSILKSRIYLGDMVQGIYECSRFKRAPSKRKSPEDWYITPNTHESIVDHETWEHVQICIGSRKRVTKSNEIQLFAGFLKCEDCGHTLSYAYCQGIPQYTCGYYRRFGREACSCHYIRKDTLEQVILNDIRRYARLAQDNEESLAEQLSALNGTQEEKRIQALSIELKTAQVRYAELDCIMKRLYEDSVSGRITDSRFQKMSADYEREQTELGKQIESKQNELDSIQQTKQDSSAWLSIIKDFADIQKLDRIVLSELIDKITVGESKIVNGKSAWM